MQCAFCKIVAGELPARMVYEDERVAAFHDINPVAPLHILVVPRRHIATTNELDEHDEALMGHLLLTAKRIAREYGVADDGYRLVLNCNHDAGQTVFHIHLHLLAKRHLSWPPG